MDKEKDVVSVEGRRVDRRWFSRSGENSQGTMRTTDDPRSTRGESAPTKRPNDTPSPPRAVDPPSAKEGL
jgi:hypothetical protein